TATGQFVGTLDYAAPEQFEGTALSARTDVYSLGCVLYECLTGHVPFLADQQAAVMFGHLNTPPPKVTTERPETPPAIDEVVSKAMAKRADVRYHTAGELATATSRALAPVRGPEEPPSRSTGTSRRLNALRAIAGALVIGLVAVALLVSRHHGRNPVPGHSPS